MVFGCSYIVTYQTSIYSTQLLWPEGEMIRIYTERENHDGMGIRVHIEHGKGTLDLDLSAGETALKVLEKLNLYPDGHLVLRDRTPIPIDEELKDGDRIKIIKVASGG
jgi:sulfur carrier protein ThiS